MSNKKKNPLYIIIMGWMIIFSSCSIMPSVNQSTIDQQLTNISKMESFSVASLHKYLSPNGEWYVESIYESDIQDKYQAVSTKDSTLIMEESADTGISYFYSWSPDSSAFVAVGYENLFPGNDDKVLIISFAENELSTAIFYLPIEYFISIEWFSDSQHLLVRQKDTFYIIDREGHLEQEFSYNKPDNVLSITTIDSVLVIFSYSDDKTELLLTSIDITDPEASEKTTVLGYFQLASLWGVHYDTKLIAYLEKDNNRIWLYDVDHNEFYPTTIFISGRVARIDVVGQKNEICIWFQGEDRYYVNIYDLDSEELKTSVSAEHYFGWYSGLGGFLIWSDMEEGKLEVINKHRST